MSERYSGLVLGYHGCDRDVAERVVNGVEHIKPSRNSYDWLGHGIYFWENNARRALEWARRASENPRSGRETIKQPAVVGAVLDLGNCLNLTDSRFLSLLPKAFEELARIVKDAGGKMPVNRPIKESKDVLLRDLDCAVIETLHKFRQTQGELEFDSARGVFTEGDAIYPGAEIRAGNHIQICVRNIACVRGYFYPADF